jgi:predicted secreted acid phosphatase
MQLSRVNTVLVSVLLNVLMVLNAQAIQAPRALRVQPSLQCALENCEPANASIVKDDIRMYRESGQWDDAISCVVQQARQALEKYIPVGKNKYAVVFDIDETLLSNWQHLVVGDFGYDHDRTKRWEMAAKDPAILSMLDLYNFAKKNGFALFLITGRRENQREATELNLRRAGYKGWKAVYFKPMDYKGSSAVPFKSHWRHVIENMGYTIVVSIGDQMSDLLGTPQALHNFKLSNPAYYIP